MLRLVVGTFMDVILKQNFKNDTISTSSSLGLVLVTTVFQSLRSKATRAQMSWRCSPRSPRWSRRSQHHHVVNPYLVVELTCFGEILVKKSTLATQIIWYFNAFLNIAVIEPIASTAQDWQKKYYRMLRLGERATRVPKPRQAGALQLSLRIFWSFTRWWCMERSTAFGAFWRRPFSSRKCFVCTNQPPFQGVKMNITQQR